MFMFDDFMFQIIPIIVGIIFVIVIGGILFTAIGGISRWSKNNSSPQLTVPAKVAAKRTAVRGGGETRAYNDYFVTFEVESGDRMELEVKDTDYGMLVEGDKGELSFQGSRFLGFKRAIELGVQG
ncbi:DUF2500 domain-containing protein [Robertmurraya kyonggiensis]|uniref:DUF2500 domain-containing protein n=1 Tax=Robertmurraya kyonggiensis TaxID=1037680 RepID=A0A4U1DBI3_9BACI|nr:DUF2500 domain-containing protein [Robertmurraya kyonggiensis]TKC18836.1 DUF2500 domain-containing protein [Robertmurraya kyonggiensis]